MYNPSRQEVDSVLADMARHLRMDAHEGAALGAGFHAASVMSQDELKRQRARAMLHEARRLNRIQETPQCSRCGSLTVSPGMCRQCFEAGPLPCPYDTPEPRMTWLGVIWGALVVFALWVRDVLARLTGRAG